MTGLTLEGIEKMLKDGDYECAIIGEDENLARAHLQVLLGSDSLGSEQTLDVCIQEDLLGDPRLSSKESKPLRLLKVAFQARLPVKIQDLAIEDVACLLHFINRTIDLPGFELDEHQGSVGYRYIHLTQDGQEAYPLVRALVGVIRLFLELFGGVITEVAEGQKSFDDILDVIIGHVKEMGLGVEG